MKQIVMREDKINLSKMLQQALDNNVKDTLQRKCEPWDKRRIKQ